MKSVREIVLKVKENASYIALLPSSEKNRLLTILADSLIGAKDEILSANAKDIKNASDCPEHFRDRLALSEARIAGMAEGIRTLIALEDPIGEEIERFKTKEGLDIRKIRVPMGVVGIVYEARPNVTADAVALCLKSGNAVVLRGSKDAIESNRTIVNVFKKALEAHGKNGEFIGLIEDTSRESVNELMQLNGLVDVLIPRGGAGLIRSVVDGASVPVIETGTGNCHIYAHSAANFDMAVNILIDAKTSRPSVCNAAESLLVDDKIARQFLPRAETALKEKGVKLLGCQKTQAILHCDQAGEEDFYREFLGYVISVKVVEGLDEAIRHVNRYGTGHSDCIVTEDEKAAKRFLNEVDSACVYHNASTRFTDGFLFGFGAEMGISTQKLHARGPMGLKELTTYKYEIQGNGQTR